MSETKSIFGLLGKDISYSFSKDYFTKKFKNLGYDNFYYDNFDLQKIDDIIYILNQNMESLKGMNVTIPYKEEVFKYLDEIDDEAKEIGAVNTIKILDDFRLKGFNTDVYGFEKSIKPLIKKGVHNKALILGTGGASKAIAYVLNKMNISCYFVSRDPQFENTISYDDLSKEILSEHLIVVNCSPIGTFPNNDLAPNIPYEFVTENHLLYDLIYNPIETLFLKRGKEKGATIKNGLQMLELQADRSWEIWND